MPKMVEVDETELLQSKQLKDHLAALMKNPKSRRKVLEAQKELDPNTAIPELDSTEPALSAVEEMRKDLAAFRKEENDRREKEDADRKTAQLQTSVSAGLAKLRSRGWTDDGIKAVEKIMEDEGILNPEIAANHYEKLHPPPQPATPSGTGSYGFMDMPADDSMADYKKLIEHKGNDDSLVSKMANDVLNEVRGQSRR